MADTTVTSAPSPEPQNNSPVADTLRAKRVQVIVLSVLAALVAGGVIALLVAGGQPSNPVIYAPGSALGIISLLLVGFAIKNSRKTAESSEEIRVVSPNSASPVSGIVPGGNSFPASPPTTTHSTPSTRTATPSPPPLDLLVRLRSGAASFTTMIGVSAEDIQLLLTRLQDLNPEELVILRNHFVRGGTQQDALREVRQEMTARQGDGRAEEINAALLANLRNGADSFTSDAIAAAHAEDITAVRAKIQDLNPEELVILRNHFVRDQAQQDALQEVRRQMTARQGDGRAEQINAALLTNLRNGADSFTSDAIAADHAEDIMAVRAKIQELTPQELVILRNHFVRGGIQQDALREVRQEMTARQRDDRAEQINAALMTNWRDSGRSILLLYRQAWDYVEDVVAATEKAASLTPQQLVALRNHLKSQSPQPADLVTKAQAEIRTRQQSSEHAKGINTELLAELRCTQGSFSEHALNAAETEDVVAIIAEVLNLTAKELVLLLRYLQGRPNDGQMLETVKTQVSVRKEETYPLLLAGLRGNQDSFAGNALEMAGKEEVEAVFANINQLTVNELILLDHSRDRLNLLVQALDWRTVETQLVCHYGMKEFPFSDLSDQTFLAVFNALQAPPANSEAPDSARKESAEAIATAVALYSEAERRILISSTPSSPRHLGEVSRTLFQAAVNPQEITRLKKLYSIASMLIKLSQTDYGAREAVIVDIVTVLNLADQAQSILLLHQAITILPEIQLLPSCQALLIEVDHKQQGKDGSGPLVCSIVWGAIIYGLTPGTNNEFLKRLILYLIQTRSGGERTFARLPTHFKCYLESPGRRWFLDSMAQEFSISETPGVSRTTGEMPGSPPKGE